MRSDAYRALRYQGFSRFCLLLILAKNICVFSKLYVFWIIRAQSGNFHRSVFINIIFKFIWLLIFKVFDVFWPQMTKWESEGCLRNNVYTLLLNRGLVMVRTRCDCYKDRSLKPELSQSSLDRKIHGDQSSASFKVFTEFGGD